jgi:hypothetical protein
VCLSIKQGCVSVFLGQDIVQEYHNSYSNSILWPLLHYGELPQDAYFESQFNAYKRANEMKHNRGCKKVALVHFHMIVPPQRLHLSEPPLYVVQSCCHVQTCSFRRVRSRFPAGDGSNICATRLSSACHFSLSLHTPPSAPPPYFSFCLLTAPFDLHSSVLSSSALPHAVIN